MTPLRHPAPRPPTELTEPSKHYLPCSWPIIQPPRKERQIPGDCELESLAKKFGIDHSSFEPRPATLPTDGTSLVIAVDHNAWHSVRPLHPGLRRHQGKPRPGPDG